MSAVQQSPQSRTHIMACLSKRQCAKHMQQVLALLCPVAPGHAACMRACASIQGTVCAGVAAAWMCAAGLLSPQTHSMPCATCKWREHTLSTERQPVTGHTPATFPNLILNFLLLPYQHELTIYTCTAVSAN